MRDDYSNLEFGRTFENMADHSTGTKTLNVKARKEQKRLSLKPELVFKTVFIRQKVAQMTENVLKTFQN